MSQHDRYISPFSTRYSSDEMQYIFSDDNKFRTWRRLWVALARAEMEQGLTNITPEMVAELEAMWTTSTTRSPLRARSWCAMM